ncbi:glucose-6-phosphate isomerase [Wenyingzhuangia marina]|uniref:Glucose-6-phosphate isomerase n=1 Tax=Wenyingzhuangia marina TaxID=1195760 RepID=A0A1M5SY45_9FLAO|nr:glucose-6-phosphate isomerase [Wenyingzhuangia marina]GGF64620.1 glucose-6-phosphate isomerase [Wenyingzhuangia marina]SHH43414.1 glucose-6-phosphate isomerase [Wenyingzhuangia marina]
MLKNINPTKTNAWKKLTEHFQEAKNLELQKLFADDQNRSSNYEISLGDLKLNYAKNRINKETLSLLVDLAKEAELEDAIQQYFGGEIINATERRAVLHTALRNNSGNAVYSQGEDVMPEVNAAKENIKAFTEKVISGNWKGYTGKAITDIVNIGIGGSDLGPNMVVDGLQYYKNHLNTHFVSNIDGDHVSEVIKKLNPETTLFVVVSKTFTTQETIGNAITIKEWFLQSAQASDVAKHFVAVSTNLEAVANFGIAPENVFPMWNWVGGRFSLWSAVGLSIALSIGYDNYAELLNGAYEMDNHFKTAKFEENIPVILALLSIWYNNFYGAESEAVLPYTQYLNTLPSYLQQAFMESNGKSVDRDGNPVDYQTGTIIWGAAGTNMQHAFMQLVHQGTKLIPCDFIGFNESLYGKADHHKKLMANFYGQQDALCFGKTKEQVLETVAPNAIELPFKIFTGNRPSNCITADKLSPNSLGKIIAMYEHKIFVQGIIWNIFSFDQFGVELGKEMANKLLK